MGGVICGGWGGRLLKGRSHLMRFVFVCVGVGVGVVVVDFEFIFFVLVWFLEFDF